MRVIVTGHEGYLGSVLVPRLAAAGHQVTGIDTGWFTPCLLGPPPPGVPAIRLDLRDVRPEHCRGADAVIHLAALCNDPLGDLDAELTYEINHRATVRLARAARAAGVSRFLFSSSCSLYGAGPPGQLLTETAGFAPVTAYGRSKIWAEQDIGRLATDGFSPVFLRNATAYGFSPRMRTDLVINDLVGAAMLTGQVALRSTGTAWRPLVHVADIAAAFAALLEAPRERVHGQAYNVGRTAENYQISSVAQIVAGMIPGSEVTVAGQATADQRDYRVSCDRIAAEVPQFQPTWTVRRGVEQLAEAYQRHGLTSVARTGGRFQRLLRVEALRRAGRLDAALRWREPAPASSS